MATDGSRDVERNALTYWGSLIRPNKTPTHRLTALLRAIAICISNNFEQHDNDDLTPSQLSAFYKAVGGDYDPFFVDMPPQSIAFIYKSLGCLHSLQPASLANGFKEPEIPALKPAGFVTWQTVQILLGPQEHVPFLQNALKMFNVVDPGTGAPFPKILPREAFPPLPDREMLEWHEKVGEHLRADAESSNSLELSTSADNPGDERADAASFFSNPLYKNREGRPGIVRNITKAVPKNVKQGGTMVMHTMRNIVDPHLWDKRPPQERSHYSDHDGERRLKYGRSPRRSPGRSPLRSSPRNRSRSRSRERGLPRSRDRDHRGSPDSDDRSLSPRDMRRNKSQDPPSSPKDVFGDRAGRRSRSSSHRRYPSGGSINADASPMAESSPGGPHSRSHSQQYAYPRHDRSSMAYRNSGGNGSQTPQGRRVSDIPEVMVEDASRRDSAPAGPPPMRQSSMRDSRRPTGQRQGTPVNLNGVSGRRYTTNTPWQA